MKSHETIQLSVQLWTWGTFALCLVLLALLEACRQRRRAKHERAMRLEAERHAAILQQAHNNDRRIILRLLQSSGRRESLKQLKALPAAGESRLSEPVRMLLIGGKG